MLSKNEKFLLQLKSVIEQNLSDPDFKIDQLARKMETSRTSLWRKVRQLTNLTPTEFINKMRLELAGEMILNNVDTIKNISHEVGFKGQSYFTKCFLKYYGVLPSEYSKQIKN